MEVLVLIEYFEVAILGPFWDHFGTILGSVSSTIFVSCLDVILEVRAEIGGLIYYRIPTDLILTRARQNLPENIKMRISFHGRTCGGK